MSSCLSECFCILCFCKSSWPAEGLKKLWSIGVSHGFNNFAVYIKMERVNISFYCLRGRKSDFTSNFCSDQSFSCTTPPADLFFLIPFEIRNLWPCGNERWQTHDTESLLQVLAKCKKRKTILVSNIHFILKCQFQFVCVGASNVANSFCTEIKGIFFIGVSGLQWSSRKRL